MPAPRPYDYAELFLRALDSACVSLQLRLDRDDAGDDPMADMVRTEVEKEMFRLADLRDRIKEAKVLGPSMLGRFVQAHRNDIGKVVDSYAERLQKSMSSGQEYPYSPSFKRTHRELESLKLARLSLVK